MDYIIFTHMAYIEHQNIKLSNILWSINKSGVHHFRLWYGDLPKTSHGESSSGNRATVVCNGPVGFSFTNMVEFFSFYLYRSWSYGSDPASNSALFLQSTQLTKLFLPDNLGTALVVCDMCFLVYQGLK